MYRQCWIGLSLLGLVCAAGVAGCNRSDSTADSDSADRAELTAEEVLQSAREAYLEAGTYVDRGQLVLDYQLNGAPQREVHPFSLAYRKPQQWHARLFNASLSSDGKQFAFAVNDPSTGHMDQQVVVRDREQVNSLDELYLDPILAHFAGGGAEIPISSRGQQASVELTHPALALLTPTQLPAWLGGAKSAELKREATIANRACYQVAVKTDLGVYRIWIEKESRIIRRIDFPPELLDAELLRSPEVRGLQLYADMADAKFEEPLDADVFALDFPDSVRKVRHFVSLPEPFPSEIIGKPLAPLDVQALDGTRIANANMRGRIQAMLWFSTDPVCGPVVRQFEEVSQSVAASIDVQFSTWCAEPPSTINDVTLVNLMQQWNCTAPVVRSGRSVGETVFDIRALPTLVVADADGVVQFYRVIENGQLRDELTAVLNRVARGEDLAAEMRKEYDEYFRQYLRQVAAASIDRDPMESQEATVPVGVPARPELVNLDEIWTASGFKRAGNIAHYQMAGEDRFVVLDGFRTIVELDDDGREKQRVELSLPTGVALTLVRPIVIADQAWFVGGSLLGTQVFVFDSDWQLVATLACGGSSEIPLRDFAPVEVSGEPEIWLAPWRDGDLIRFNLRGEETARGSMPPQVHSMIARVRLEPSQDAVLVVDDSNSILRLGSQGQTRGSTGVDGGTISHLFAVPGDVNWKHEWLAFGSGEADSIFAMGLNRQLKVKWKTSIEAGAFNEHVQFVSADKVDAFPSADSETTLAWAILRPTGTVYLLADQARRSDRFHPGFRATGICLTQTSQGSLLLLSRPAGVQAWRMSERREVSDRSVREQVPTDR